jgi:signal transduction histidine kinase
MNANNRWWYLAVAGTVLVLGVMVQFTDAPSQGGRWQAWICLAVIAAAYFSFGRLSCGKPSGYLFVAIIITAGALGVAGSTTLMTVQAIVLPLIWITIESVGRIIVANVILTLAFTVGFWAGARWDLDALAVGATIEALSLAFSIGLGLWITKIGEVGDEKARLLAELTAAQDELAALHRESGATSERERFARDLHDTIAQSLTGIVMLTQRSRREAASGDLDGLPATLELVEESARAALSETRSLVAATAPVELGDGGIAAALDRLAERFSRESGVAVKAFSRLDEPLATDNEVVLLRCAQESLANIRKHAGARNASLRLVASVAETTLTITDDGVGFDVDAAPRGFGLSGMRDRVALVGGGLTVSRGTERGSVVTVSLPGQATREPTVSSAPAVPATAVSATPAVRRATA